MNATPPRCEVNMDAYADCAAKCEVDVDPGKLELECKGGDVVGKCSGECKGACYAKVDGECSGSCEGTCSGGCSGICDGHCDGTCKTKGADGQCNGACDGTCDGTCEGTWLHAGMKNGATRAPWDTLLSQIDATEALAEAAQEHFVLHAPHVELLGEEEPLLELNAALLAHVRAGKGLGALDLLLRPRFREYLSYTTVGGRRPERPEHFAALGQHLTLRQARRELAQRWDRLIHAGAGPAAADLGADVEVGARQLAPELEAQLAWHRLHFVPLLAELSRVGLAWEALLAREPPVAGAHGDVQRVVRALGGALLAELRARQQGLRADSSDQELARLIERLKRGHQASADSPAALLARAVEQRDVASYRSAWERVRELNGLRSALALRAELLARLASVAPGWVDAISQRSRMHGMAKPPPEAHAAFRWLRLKEELERRAARNLAALQAQRERCTVELHEATSELIEARAWLAQARRMTLSQQQALTGWLDTQRAIGKGTGKKAPEMKAEARRLMSGCQTAVPVWIMPLSRVVESFDPRHVRFDVVIIDEASQCDLLALVALYLGRQAVVVGDHEQVSPSAVGESAEASSHLIAQHLLDIPNAHLYDGKLSVYDLARQSFGGMLALREQWANIARLALSPSTMLRALRSARGQGQSTRHAPRTPWSFVRWCGLRRDHARGVGQWLVRLWPLGRCTTARLRAFCALPEKKARDSGGRALRSRA